MRFTHGLCCALAAVSWLAQGCATTNTPENRVKREIYWEAAVECESRYRTLHLDQVDTDGTASMHADAESRHELPPFIACYQKAVQSRIAQRRSAGLPIPEDFNEHPTAEVD